MTMLLTYPGLRPQAHPRRRSRPGQRFQVYGIDAEGRVTHAGGVNAPRINARVAKRIQRKWEAWRAQYLRDHPGEYPLRHTAPTVQLAMHPVGHPHKCQWFPV